MEAVTFPPTKVSHLRQHLVLPTVGKCCLSRVSFAGREHSGILLCFRFSMKHSKSCCLSNSKFLKSAQRNPENCEAYSCMKPGELSLEQDHSSDCRRTFLTKSQLWTSIPSQACHPSSEGIYREITALPQQNHCNGQCIPFSKYGGKNSCTS